MDPESSVGGGVADFPVDANELKSRHKFTVAHIPQETVDLAQLSGADRRLAEMGYVQVSLPLFHVQLRFSKTEYMNQHIVREWQCSLECQQVYRREFSWLSCVSFALAISGLYASVTTTFIYPLEAGGASSAVWCWLISGFGCYCIALSVAEIVSAYPTSGGMYFTCKYLAPENWVPEIAWLTGWLNLLGQVAGVASSEYGCAQLLLAAVSMGKDFKGYLPTNRQTVGVMATSTIFHGAINSLTTSALEKITRSYVVFHIAILVACMITLLTICNNKDGLGLHSSEYVWTEVVNNSGWAPNGWSWLFGFLASSWTNTVSTASLY